MTQQSFIAALTLRLVIFSARRSARVAVAAFIEQGNAIMT